MDTSVRILRVFLTRWLDKAETDTNRTLRMLVEFGCYFSASLHQRKFFFEAKRILSNKESRYYSLAQSLFRSVDKERAAEFGICFGYYGLAKSSWFSGEHLCGFQKPTPVAGIIPGRKLRPVNNDLSGQFSTLAQGGTNIFFIFCDDISFSESELFAMIEKNPHKSFFLFTESESTAIKFAQKNVMPVLNLESSNYDFLADELRKYGRFFGGYYQYGDAEADIITAADFLENIYERNCLFLFLVENEECSNSTHKKIQKFGYSQKRNPTHPVFVTELFGDLEALNGNDRKVCIKKTDWKQLR